MMQSTLRSMAAATALLSLAVPQAAYAADCVQEDDLADAVVYFMPVAYSAFTTKCAASLADEGFVNREGDAFIAGFAGKQDGAWSGAFNVLKVFTAKRDKDGSMARMFDAMPPEALRPLFDSLVQMEIAKEIKLDQCGKIEKVLEPLAPLPPENWGKLASVIAGMIPDIKDPQICAAETQ